MVKNQKVEATPNLVSLGSNSYLVIRCRTGNLARFFRSCSRAVAHSPSCCQVTT